jgi:hypothetical protein
LLEFSTLSSLRRARALPAQKWNLSPPARVEVVRGQREVAMPSRRSVLGSAALALATAATVWGFWYFAPAENCPPPSPQSVETLFAPCQAAHSPLAASRDPIVTEGRGSR